MRNTIFAICASEFIAKINTAQDDAPRRSLESASLEFPSRGSFGPVAQSEELFLALVVLGPGHMFEVIHRSAADGARNFVISIHHGKEHDHAAKIKPTDGAAYEHRVLHLFSFRRWRIDFGYLPQASRLGLMRARNKCPADLGRVPAGDDAEAERLFGLDVPRGKILH